MRRCSVGINLSETLGIGFPPHYVRGSSICVRFSLLGREHLNTDLVAAEGLNWGVVIALLLEKGSSERFFHERS